MKYLLLIGYILTLLIYPLSYMGYGLIDLSGGDKTEHYFWGLSQMGLYQHWGWSKEQSYKMVFLAGLLKEAWDVSKGGNFDWNDMLANMLGAYSFEVIDGIYLKVIYKP